MELRACGVLRGERRAEQRIRRMTKDEITAWALANGWQMVAGCPSLTKPSAPKEAIVRLALKATVVNLEVKKPAGKWEKFSGAPYSDVVMGEDAEIPSGLSLDTIPGFAMLMRDNKDRMVFASMKRMDRG